MRRFLAASAVLLGAAFAFAVPGQAAAQETGPTSQACADANALIAAGSDAVKAVEAAQRAYDTRPSTTTEAEAKALFDALNAKKEQLRLLTADRDAKCASNSGGMRQSCADYARIGVFDIRRGDARYRDVLDRDNDGVACERNNDDDPGRFGNGRFDRDRDCRELRQARDRVQDARTDLERKNKDFRAESSDAGTALSDSERDELRRLARVVDDRERDLDRERREASNRCDDRDDDVSVPDPVIPDININVTVPSAAPTPSTGGSVASNAPSVGAAETGEPPAEDESTAIYDAAIIANSVAVAGVSLRVFVDLGGVK